MPQPVKWPSDARCAVMLTLDLDGESRPSRVRMLERPIQLILGKRRVWWPKPIELARFWLGRPAGAAGG